MGLRTEIALTSAKMEVDSIQEEKKGGDLYKELWHACAGPHVYIPCAGDMVFYFPQGHMEQVEKYTNQDGMVEMPIYDLPPKILCRVVCVQLRAENSTDEVFAQITLLPEKDDPSSSERGPKHLPQKAYPCSFSKKLTPSDTSTHGGFSIPRRYADECLPPLDMSRQPPAQELVAKDLQGIEWHFRHIYRGCFNMISEPSVGQPRRHLLSSGWRTFATSKKLVTGDSFILLRGENGDLHVGIRRALLPNNASNSLISSHSMQHGILATASHAICSGTMFTVYYRPWASREFIIPFDWCIRMAEFDCTRFRMFCEGEEHTEQRVLGTIVGIEDVDRIRWPDSEWRCLKVKWDTVSDAIVHPDRVCPWNIELVKSTSDRSLQFLHYQKRICAHDASSHVFSKLARNGLMQRSVNCAPQSPPRVFQGQEFSNMSFNQSGELRSQLFPHLGLSQNPGLAQTQSQTEKQLRIPVCDTLHQYPSSTAIFSSGKAACFGLPFGWPATFSNEGHADSVTSRKLSSPKVNFDGMLHREWINLKLGNESEAAIAEPNGGRYMLFGVSLVNCPPELSSPQVLSSNEIESLCSIPPRSQAGDSDAIQVSKPARSSSGIYSKNQCKNCCTSINRSCTKVLKHGSALGRSIDLRRFDGYEELIAELDQMFDFRGSLINGSSQWHVTYTDNEGDIMLIGDYPWQEFQDEVRKMLILPKEEIDRLSHSSENPLSQQTLSAEVSNAV